MFLKREALLDTDLKFRGCGLSVVVQKDLRIEEFQLPAVMPRNRLRGKLVEGRGSKPLTLLGLATAVEKSWIEESFSTQLQTSLEHIYDRTHKRVAAIKLVRSKGNP